MHPHLSFELSRQRAAEAARGIGPVPAGSARPARTRRSSFVLVRATGGARVFRRVRPEGGEP